MKKLLISLTLIVFSSLNANLKVAVCYWGLTRSTKHVYQSHFDKLYRILDQNQIDYDVFLHTWHTNSKQRVRQREVGVPIDYDEYQLLKPKYFQRDDQDEFTSHISVNDYFNRNSPKDNLWSQPNVQLNLICALESQRRVTDMVIQSHNHYDLVMYVRPDAQLLENFPIDKIYNLRDCDILIPNFDHWLGFNDRFAVLTYNTAPKYGNRIVDLERFKNRNRRITSEKLVWHICVKYNLNPIMIPFRFNLVRPG